MMIQGRPRDLRFPDQVSLPTPMMQDRHSRATGPMHHYGRDETVRAFPVYRYEGLR